MHSNIKLLCVALFALLATVACIKEPETSFTDIEQRSLKAWIEKYHPELLENYQEEGGYYVEVLNAGVADSIPVTGKDVWLWYDFTGRSLEGDVCETRNWLTAYQQGTYNEHTRYIPAFRFSGSEAHTIHEGTYLATFNKLNIGGEEFEVRYGTELRLYLPSSIISESTSADGGYEGQFALDQSRPMIVDMKIYGHIGNPVAYEGSYLDAFAVGNGGLCDEHKSVVEEEEAEKAARYALRRHITRGDDTEEEVVDTRPLEFYDGRWHQPVDTMAHLYVNYTYSPERMTLNYNVLGTDTLKYPNEMEYKSGDIYGTSSISDIDRRINEALVERFGKGISMDNILEADSINTKATAKVWYVGRFLDGYVFDTNIDEVKQIVYGKVESEGTALSFSTDDPTDNDYILAWNYAIPTLRRGQWAAILTASTYGYGIAGVVGSHTSTTTSNDNAYYDYLNYMNYMNYMNNYYGYGYGNSYNQGYYGYNPYYYGYGYYPTTDENTSTTVTTTSTEIPAYSPLLFQIFIEE